MPAATHLPPAPSLPVSQLPRDQVRSLAHVFGQHKRHAQYRFCALLPIVVRDKIYLDDGCRDEYEWAAKFGAMSREEVDRVVGLWGSIGEYHCLWSLLGQGVGISKLERVAPHVTPDNAGWMAQQVQRLTKPELEELMRSVRRTREAERRAAAPAESPAGERRATSEASPGSQASLGLADAPPACQAPESSQGPGTKDSPESAAGSETRRAVPTGPFEPAVGSISGFLPEVADLPAAAQNLLSDLTDAQAVPGNAESGPDESGAVPDEAEAVPREADAIDEIAPRVSKCRLTLELDAIGEKRIRELQTLYERLHGRPIGIGQLVSLLARWAVIRGELPSLEQVERGVVHGHSAGGTESRVANGTHDNQEAPALTPSAASGAAQMLGGAPGSGRAPAQVGGRVPAAKPFQPRLLEVVISISETGWKFVRTALGWVPVSNGAVAGFLAKGQPIPLENLRIAAIAASQVVSGKRYRPAAVDRYLSARSGGYCEVRGCNRKAVAAHHRNRFAFDPSHHPDALVCVCHLHHGVPHKGLVRNEAGDPMNWELLREGEDPELNDVDVQYQGYLPTP